jgi:hypothetical protein
MLVRRVFMSLQNPERMGEDEIALQNELIRRVQDLGYQPEIFFRSGTAAGLAWSLPNLVGVMRRCAGAVVLATRRWTVPDPRGDLHFASEYAQIEGAVATTLRLPLLLIAERGLVDRGITWTGAGHPILFMPAGGGVEWLSKDTFTYGFRAWSDQLGRQADVFLGYSSKAQATARAIHAFLTERVKAIVRSWEIGFYAGGMILDEIEAAARSCSTAVFLFTKDDELVGDEVRAAPRDNVVFEAGYFNAVRGRRRVLIIREEGAKMPADLGGVIYLRLDDRYDIRSIQSSIQEFIEQRP